MIAVYQIFGVVAFAIAGALVVTHSTPATVEAAQKKGAPKAAPPKAYRVQVRHPGWKRFAVTTNPAAAQNLARTLRLTGWTTVQIRKPKPGVFLVRAKIARWRDRAVVTNPAVAQALVNVGISQGFQARAVPIRR